MIVLMLKRKLILALVAAIAIMVGACSNSERECSSICNSECDFVIFSSSGESNVSALVTDEVSCSSSVQDIVQSSSSSEESSNLVLEDGEYPYSGLPRIVIETENFQAIVDRETKIPAKMQIYGKELPESEIMDLTIHGRGNSSWNSMPKKSYRIELNKKKALFRMPQNKDWSLIANYADKTLMKNYLSYDMARRLGMYAPRCEYAELFVNKEYLGVYLFTETIKQGKNRVDIPDGMNSYIVEFDEKFRDGEQVVFSEQISSTPKPFRVHFPKDASKKSLETLSEHITAFETFLTTIDSATPLDSIEAWLDIDAFVKHYWVQELVKNPDASYYTSVYFTWVYGEKIKMGPVWDFDIALGGHYEERLANPKNWRIRPEYWNSYLFKSQEFQRYVDSYYERNKAEFYKIYDIIDSLQEALAEPSRNNFKRWDILQQDGKWISKAVQDYGEAVRNMKSWLQERITWIEEQL